MTAVQAFRALPRADAEAIADLIDDCRRLPSAWQPRIMAEPPAAGRRHSPIVVSDGCASMVDGLDPYGS